MGFIYKVTNNINGKVYIGKTKQDVKKRFLQHKNEAKNEAKNLIKNKPFHKALQQYGYKNFEFNIIEEIPDDFLEEREIYWIKYYNSYIYSKNSNGYNATRGGNGTLKYNYKALAKAYLNNGNKSKTAKQNNCCISTINKVCKEYNLKTKLLTTGILIQRIDINGKIKEYPSIKKAAEDIAVETNKNIQTIRKRITFLLNHNPNQKAYGYFWKKIY